MQTFLRKMENLERENKGMLSNLFRLWNMDETTVDACYWKQKEVFVALVAMEESIRE